MPDEEIGEAAHPIPMAIYDDIIADVMLMKG